MAIGFLPSEEDTDARYARLNALLLELYDVLYHLMDGRDSTAAAPPAPRVRPASDSSAPRLPDLLASAPRRRVTSARSPPPAPPPPPPLVPAPAPPPPPSTSPDDEVFLPPGRTPRPRRRRRCDSLKARRDAWRPEALLQDLRTEIETDLSDSGQSPDKVAEPENTLLSTFLSGGSLWTAVVLVVGWRLLATKR